MSISDIGLLDQKVVKALVSDAVASCEVVNDLPFRTRPDLFKVRIQLYASIRDCQEVNPTFYRSNCKIRRTWQPTFKNQPYI